METVKLPRDSSLLSKANYQVASDFVRKTRSKKNKKIN